MSLKKGIGSPEGLQRNLQKDLQREKKQALLRARSSKRLLQKFLRDPRKPTMKDLEKDIMPVKSKKTSRLESSRLREEPAEQNPIICARTQPRIQEKPRIPEKVISRDKHTTIFTPFDTDKKDNSYLPRREEAKKPPENREKRKKLDKVIEIDLPDTYEEDFWS